MRWTCLIIAFLIALHVHAQPAISVPIDTLTLHFDFDRSELRPVDSLRLDRYFRLKAAVDSVHIFGYTDTAGGSAYNQRLSLRRATAVRAALPQLPPAAAPPLRVEARGETDPLPGDDSLSRRAVLVVYYHRKDTLIDTPAAPVRSPGEPDTVFALQNINFVANTPVLTDAAKLELPKTVPYLRSLSDRYLEINGFCNSPGPLLPKNDPLYVLSVKRAKYIYDYLVRQGLDPAHLRYVGRGNASPLIAHPTTREQMDENMRVEIRVYSFKF